MHVYSHIGHWLPAPSAIPSPLCFHHASGVERGGYGVGSKEVPTHLIGASYLVAGVRNSVTCRVLDACCRRQGDRRNQAPPDPRASIRKAFLVGESGGSLQSPEHHAIGLLSAVEKAGEIGDDALAALQKAVQQSPTPAPVGVVPHGQHHGIRGLHALDRLQR